MFSSRGHKSPFVNQHQLTSSYLLLNAQEHVILYPELSTENWKELHFTGQKMDSKSPCCWSETKQLTHSWDRSEVLEPRLQFHSGLLFAWNYQNSTGKVHSLHPPGGQLIIPGVHTENILPAAKVPRALHPHTFLRKLDRNLIGEDTFIKFCWRPIVSCMLHVCANFCS